MTRDEKIKILEAIKNGSLNPQTLVSKTVHFMLPANDGTDNISVVTSFGTKVYSKEQFKRTKLHKAWTEAGK